MSTLTIKDIARICGVSTSTVSRAMNDDSGINKETKARILKTIEEYNFVPNNSARNLKVLESNTIALLIKGIDNPFFQGMIPIFENELNKLEYSFLMHTVGADQDEIAVAAELIKERKLKGIIFLGGRLENSEERLKPIGVPYVRCTGATEASDSGWSGSSIAIDDVKESIKAVEYLINMGHRRIALMTTEPADKSVGKLRLEGYKKALAKHNIPFDENLVFYSKISDRAFSMGNGYALAKELMERKVDCSAIFSVSDVMTIGIYKAIYDAGKSIPEDYSIVGFDGVELSQYCQPALTTVKQPVEEMVKASITQLMNAIEGREVDNKIFFDATLIERDSVKAIGDGK